MAKKRKPATAVAKEPIEAAGSLSKDIEQLASAMARIKDPSMRYMLALFVDMASQRIAQLEARPLGAVAQAEMVATKH